MPRPSCGLLTSRRVRAGRCSLAVVLTPCSRATAGWTKTPSWRAWCLRDARRVRSVRQPLQDRAYRRISAATWLRHERMPIC